MHLVPYAIIYLEDPSIVLSAKPTSSSLSSFEYHWMFLPRQQRTIEFMYWHAKILLLPLLKINTFRRCTQLKPVVLGLMGCSLSPMRDWVVAPFAVPIAVDARRQLYTAGRLVGDNDLELVRAWTDYWLQTSLLNLRYRIGEGSSRTLSASRCYVLFCNEY